MIISNVFVFTANIISILFYNKKLSDVESPLLRIHFIGIIELLQDTSGLPFPISDNTEKAFKLVKNKLSFVTVAASVADKEPFILTTEGLE